MQTSLFLLLIVSSVFATGQALSETPQQALNQYVAFLNQSVDEVTQRLQLIQTYYAEMSEYKAGRSPLRMSPSGTLEEYYYKKAVAGTALTEPEKQRLKTGAQALWQSLNKIGPNNQSVRNLQPAEGLRTR